jgi:hypothetical protein
MTNKNTFFYMILKWHKTIFILLAFLLIAPESGFTAKKKKKKSKKPTGTLIGPTGILGNYQPTWPKTANQIVVTYIEKGSPAYGSKLKVGDIIEGFGDEKFKRHPLWDLAIAIENSESKDGNLPLLLKQGKKVSIKINAIGAYSETAPYNCSKTNYIITKAADALLETGFGGTPTQTGLLGLLATGEKKYIDAVGKYIYDKGMHTANSEKIDAYLDGKNSEFGSTGWVWGYNLIVLGEYFLLTNDEKVLPAIKTYALALVRGQDGLGLWGHRVARAPSFRAPGYGVMHQPSLSNLLGLLIAQKCGIEDKLLEKGIKKTYTCVSNVVGRGGFSYGSGGSYPSYFNNNGTSGSGALCMMLKGNLKGATFFSQNAATAYNSLTSGHASSFFNPLWTPAGASLSGPKVTQQFFKKSLWYFTGKRHWSGSFPERSNAGYVAGQALLAYCIPRKALLITGREADKSIHIKDSDVNKVIMRSQINYKKKSIPELITLFDDIIQVRLKAVKELSSRAGRGKKPDTVTPVILKLAKNGDNESMTKVLFYLSHCHVSIAPKYISIPAKILQDKKASFQLRIKAAKTLSQKVFSEKNLPYYSDILNLVLEKRTEEDPLGIIDDTLSKALASITQGSGVKALEIKPAIDKIILYKVANQFLDHKRQKVRQIGGDMLIGIPKADFYLIAEKLLYVLKNEDPTYHSYSQAVNVPGITILAENNIKEGLDLLVHAIYHGGGKWGFRYRGLMQALPHYGKNAEPYIKKFEAHRSINKEGDRFTPAWQKVVKKIREDTKAGKLISVEEVIQMGKTKNSQP